MPVAHLILVSNLVFRFAPMAMLFASAVPGQSVQLAGGRVFLFLFPFPPSISSTAVHCGLTMFNLFAE